MSRRRGFSKKRRFLQFSIAAPKKISNGCQSDNFDPRTFAYGSSESLCPKFSETHAGKVSIFKIVGARPLRSQVIRKSCRLKRCFFGNFWEKMLSHGQTVHFWPHSVIHIRKAVHLRIPKIRFEVHFRHPMTRQNFRDAVAQKCNPYLIWCHIESGLFGFYWHHKYISLAVVPVDLCIQAH